MSYTDEFPDFDPASLPLIPVSWRDVSWHNDDCPSWQVYEGLTVYVDYADPAQRGWPDSKRFAVHGSNAVLIETDEWDEVLRFVGQCLTSTEASDARAGPHRGTSAAGVICRGVAEIGPLRAWLNQVSGK